MSVNARSFQGRSGSGFGYDESTTANSPGENFGFLTSALFAAVAEANRSCPPPPFLGAITHIFVFLQVIFGAGFWLDPVHQIPSGFKTFLQILFFGLVGDYDTFMPYFVLLFILQLLTLSFIGMVTINYVLNHKHHPVQLWILRCWNGTLNWIMVIPNVLFGILSLAYYGHQANWQALMLLIAGMITSLSSVVYNLTMMVVLNQSPYLFHSVTIHWDQRSASVTVILLGVAIAAGSVFQKTMLSWQMFVGPVAMIVFSTRGVWKTLYFGYCGLWTNALVASLLCGAVAGSILAIVRDAGVDIPLSAQVSIPWVFVIVSLCFWAPIMHRLRKAKMAKLSYQKAFGDAKKISQKDKLEYLETVGINSIDNAMCYLRLGLEGGCDLFLDWSLTSFIFKKFNDDSLLVFMAMQVAMFPSETVMLHRLMKSIDKMKTPSFANLSLYYQLHRIHLFRHPASSNEANEDHQKVKKLTEQCISSYCQFWKDMANGCQEKAVDVYSLLSHIRSSTDALWSEMLEKYPNNPLFIEYYASYLLNAKCQFKEAVKWHQRAQGLQEGTRILQDKAFHSFVACFPFYLKQKIVDVNGKLRPAPNDLKGKQQAFAPDALQEKSGSSDFDYADGEKYVGQIRLKLAMQQSVQELRSRLVRAVRISSIFRLVFTLIYLIVLFTILYGYFSDIQALFAHLTRLHSVHESFAILWPQIPLVWAQALYPSRVDGSLLRPEEANMLKGALPTQDLIYNSAITGLKRIDNLSRNFYFHVFDEGNTTMALAKLLSNVSLFTGTCTRTTLELIHENASLTMDNLMRLFFTTSVSLVLQSATVAGKWDKSYDMCEAIIRGITVVESYKLIGTHISEPLAEQISNLRENGTIDSPEMDLIVTRDGESNASLIERLGTPVYECTATTDTNKHRNIYFLIAFTPAFLTIVAVPAAVLFISGIRAEVINYSNMLNSFSREDCLRAGERTSVMDPGQDMQVNLGVKVVSKKGQWAATVTCIILLFFLVLFPLVYLLTLDEKLASITQQYVLFSVIRSDIVDIGSHCLLMALLREATADSLIDVPYIDYTDCLKRIQSELQEIMFIDTMLELGHDTLHPAVGFDASLDELRFKERCVPPRDSTLASDYWMCLSFSRLRSYFTDKVKTVVASVEGVKIFDELTSTLIAILDARLATDFASVAAKYEELLANCVKEHTTVVWSCFCLAVVVAFCAFGIEIILVRARERDFETYKCLLLRLNPITLVSNPQTAALLFGKTTIGKVQVTSASHTVFHCSRNPMLSLNQDGVIESVNPATTTVLGFTPEQLLGQSLKIIINPDTGSNRDLFYEMQLMKSGQCTLLYQSSVTASKDDETAVLLRVVLVGLSANDRTADSFGLICCDLTEEENEKKQVESIMKESETLLEYVIPHDMLKRIDDSVCSFKVENATVGFFRAEFLGDVVKGYSAPKLLEYLNQMLKELDSHLATFPGVTRIKVVGDCYVTAGGLFSQDTDRTSGANDTIMFNLDAIEIIQTLNIKLDNFSLQAKVGVHTGGTLVAGVFGEPKVFELMGETIGCAQKLQERCEPDTINISISTYNAVVKESYQIDLHEELDIRGLGLSMTYTLSKSQYLRQSHLRGRDDSTGGSGFNLFNLLNPTTFDPNDNVLLEPEMASPTSVQELGNSNF